jgi:hypothetical protein
MHYARFSWQLKHLLGGRFWSFKAVWLGDVEAASEAEATAKGALGIQATERAVDGGEALGLLMPKVVQDRIARGGTWFVARVPFGRHGPRALRGKSVFQKIS